MDVDFKGLASALENFRDRELPAFVGDAHAALITMVGNGAIRRTTIVTGRLVNNWQGWVGPATIAHKVPEVKSFSPSPSNAYSQVGRLADEVRSRGRSGEIVEKTLIVNNAPYAGIEEDGTANRRGKHMAMLAIDEAESIWGEP